MRIGVLASGSGTILEAIIDEGLRPEVVVVDRPCRAVEVAKLAGVEVAVIERASFGPDFDRLAYTHQVVDALAAASVELVVMAGYGTILDKPIHDAYPDRILNTHPSLLPAFPGWHSVEAALAAGVKLTGCTVHVASLDVDAGPILAQEAVPVLPGDTVERLHERIKSTERRLYPRTIRQFIDSQGAPF
ncbi:MAG: phosphoribosylglycinamide formyltransferase [Acidimicrobiales bacterium]